MKFSSLFFAKNLKKWRESLDYSQDEFAAMFQALKDKSSPRAVISSYETKESVPKLEFIFEVATLTGATLDDLFSKELDFEDGGLSRTNRDMVKEPHEDSNYQPDELARLKRLVDNLSESLSSMAKLINDVPALRAEVERLKAKVAEMEGKK